ncbi:hypothetical protein K458DRAFT_417520 [Lentithecium fluviatile CBS 122367]|uniref:Uncharacterized protein n=1 Tax=Lentithecium fluviatile CBS 122367 TaxID=1168545 RepID=A0A6G1J5R7_9PLEO|nr:hypothetical protein K458DRAFT_417520 [Lentithecium fluviatile CBS 122367]
MQHCHRHSSPEFDQYERCRFLVSLVQDIISYLLPRLPDTMTSLIGKLYVAPLDRTTRLDLAAALWQDLFKENISSYDLDPYFDYYETQCHHALHEQGKHIVVRTHKHIVNIAEKLEEGCTRKEVKDEIRKLFKSKAEDRVNEEEILDNSVDLAVRLYLMVNVGANRSTVTRGRKLFWEEGSVKGLLASYFDEPQVLSNSGIRFEKTFTACNLERIAGIKIRWTNNLADHLRMVDDDDKLVAVFHHATFLEQQTSRLYPPSLIDETLRTLTLLFPQRDKRTRKWLASLPSSPPIDKRLGRLGSLHLDDRQIETYQFWHDRLIILKQAFDEARPVEISQWWHDRRNGYQWYTFWVAVFVLFLTVFFGIVQSVEGALQVWKAFHPTEG